MICSWCNSRTKVAWLTSDFHNKYPEIGEVNRLCLECKDTAIDEINAERREMECEPSEMTEWGDYDDHC